MSNNHEIKGSFGSSLPELTSNGSFYSYSGKLSGIGCVITRPDTKQGFDSLSMNTR